MGLLGVVLVGAAALPAALPFGSAVAKEGGNGRALTLQDRSEIQELYAKYNTALDSGHAEEWADTFVNDGALVVLNSDAGTIAGRDALLAFARRTGGKGSRHWNNNLLLSATPDGATGTCYVIVIGARGIANATSGAFNDLLIRTPQGWRFKKRTATLDPAPGK